MTTALSLLFLWFGSALVMAQSSKPNNCVLESAATGQMITVHGKVVHGPHDMLLDLPNCDSVVIEYAEVAAPGQDNSRHITRDSNFRRFDSYVRAEYPTTNDGGVCLGCFKYQVEATFKGRLDVARLPQALSKDSQGFLRDSSGKVLGEVGFGHPSRQYHYRLMVESISEVTARKLPRK